MREENSSLFSKIKACKGKEKCWGKLNEIIEPAVIPCTQKPEFMIITEQMNLSKKDLNELERNRDGILQRKYLIT